MKIENYTFKVSIKKDVYRIVELKGSSSLYKFASEILKAFNFDLDHCFCFYQDKKGINAYNSPELYELFVDMPECEPTNKQAKGVKKTKIKSAFTAGKKMIFYFDYGDEWVFHVECLKISHEEPIYKLPKLLEKKGRAPKQYPNY